MSAFPDSEWPPSIGDQYIPLTLIQHTNRLPTRESIREMQEDLLRGNVDKVEEERKGIDIPTIFAHLEQVKHPRVLVDGAPGVGKTTLCTKVSQDWGCEGFLSEYKLVVLLHLRDPQIAKAESIEDFFYHDDPGLQAEVVRQVRKTSGAGVLLIFDGFDELSEEKRMERSLFLDIIKGKVLSKCSVLVTSRPYASENLQCLRSVVRHVEILGFTEDQIFECVKNTIEDESKAEALISILIQRINILSLCYIPLNCAILLYVYQQLDYTLPSTLTQLFEIFILNTVKRDVKLQTTHSVARRIHDLVSIPPPFSNDLDHLCKLAFDGLIEDEMVFQYEEIEESKLLGLMTAFKSFSCVGESITYQFLHLTIQEFLAARWVATHKPPEQQATFFKEHLSDDRFRTMLLFLSGITKLHDSSFGIIFSAELDLFIPEDPEEQDRMIETENSKLFFCLVHFLYESQSTTHCHTLACAIYEQTIILNVYVSTFLFHAFVFFLRRSSCNWKRLDFGTITSENFDILCQQLEKDILGSASVQQLHVTDFAYRFPVTIKTLSRIVGIPEFKHLQRLEIVELPLLLRSYQEHRDSRLSSISSDHDLESVRCLMRNSALEELTLFCVPGMDGRVVECIGQELAVSTTLKVLDIGSDTIHNSRLCGIFHALQHNKSVERLHVQKFICGGDLRELALAVESALKVNETLQVLSFKTHEVSEPERLIEAAAQYPDKLYGGIFQAITRNNSTLKSLTIADDNFVASEEVESSLIGMLRNNKSLTSLSIIVGKLPWNLLDVLAVGLVQNSSLTRLCINSKDGKSDHEPSLSQLACALCQNSSLKTLVLNLRFFEANEMFYMVGILGLQNFVSFLRMLVVNKTLTSVTFMHHFTDHQLEVIARYLVLSGHRTEIELEFEYSYSLFQRRYEKVIQEEVDTFRRYFLNLPNHREIVLQYYKRERFLAMVCFVYHVYQQHKREQFVAMVHYVYHVYQQHKREQFVAMVHYVYHVYEIYHRPL